MRVRPLAADEYPRIYCTECQRGAPTVQRSELFVADLSQRFHFIIGRMCLKQMHDALEECRVQYDPQAKAFSDVQFAAENVTARAADLLKKVFQFEDGAVPTQLPNMTLYQVDAKEVYGHLALSVWLYQHNTAQMLKLAKEARRDA